MPELLISDPENQDESTSVREAWTQSGEAWTQSVIAPSITGAHVLWSELERVYHVNPPDWDPISAHYVVLFSGVSGTGVDDSGAKFILTQLAGWTCPAAMTAGARRRADDEPEALKRLRLLHSGFLWPAVGASAEPSSPQEMVRWLHEESGLTWDQLGRTLGVSRRSVHAWAAGQRVSGRNLERLSYVYSTINAIAASSAEDRRHTLFSPRSDMQPNLFDQLVIQARKAVPPRDENALLGRLGIAPAN